MDRSSAAPMCFWLFVVPFLMASVVAVGITIVLVAGWVIAHA